MKLSGWIFMIASWMMIISLAAFCFGKVLKKGLNGKDVTKKKKRE